MLIKKASGFDVISAVVDLTIGKLPHIERVKPENKYIFNEFIYFTIQADSYDDLKVKHIKAVNSMKVLDIKGNDIMRRDLLTDI